MKGRKWLAALLCVFLAVLVLFFARNAGKETAAQNTGAETAAQEAAGETPAQDNSAETPAPEPGEGAYTDVAVLTTTDMHGKCWDTNVLTDAAEKNNMLHVSTAARQFREKYGAENVLLIDNGDLFQGTAVSEIQLLDYISGNSKEPPAMALCLAEIGYDAFVLGNHEFNYDWKPMRNIYTWIEKQGIPVLAANVVYDGSGPDHKQGENAFTPYIIKTIAVGGREHKIGILGLENTDIERWDLPVNYPELQFVHPGNEEFSIAREAEPYLAEMRAEGCEFIIVSYHSGIGNGEGELRYSTNSDNQGLRLVRETEDIDLLILGHDHSGGYSGSYEMNRADEPVLIVNGGGQELTKTVFRFSENESGKLAWEILESGNLNLGDFGTDSALEEKILPYVQRAEAVVQAPAGTVAGDWDQSSDYYTGQTDTIDLVSAAMIEISGKRLAEEYGGDDPAALGIEGLDHLDVDMSMVSVGVNGSYVVSPGALSMKDAYRLVRFTNHTLVLPMKGSEILAVMEENAEKRLTARVMKGEAYIYTIGDNNTNIIFGGADFSYDMSKPAGERVIFEGFANGRPFEKDAVYLVAVSNYILGNEHCGLRDYGEEDTVWPGQGTEREEVIQDTIAEYIRDRCAEDGTLTPDAFGWHWSAGYSADPAALPPYEGEVTAHLTEKPEEGHTYVLYHEAEGQVFLDRVTNGGLGAGECRAWGEDLIDPLPENALLFSVRPAEDGTLYILDRSGRCLSCGSAGGLSLTDGEAANGLSRWRLEPARGGWYVVNAGEGSAANGRQALEYYNGRFSTYQHAERAQFIFNFYEVP